jgi:hypothetical protein
MQNICFDSYITIVVFVHVSDYIVLDTELVCIVETLLVMFRKYSVLILAGTWELMTMRVKP